MDGVIDYRLAALELLILCKVDMTTTVPERAGLFAAVRVLTSDIRSKATERGLLSSYASEKIGRIESDMAEVTGFGPTLGHSIEADRVSALGNLTSLRNDIERAHSALHS